ncbi:hypothetical protein BKA57DRAFT_8404 [Linnemannia elongata]|nr:hypothetical protein BKA57DRAFT_8404 [Linnemannia elongata]
MLVAVAVAVAVVVVVVVIVRPINLKEDPWKASIFYCGILLFFLFPFLLSLLFLFVSLLPSFFSLPYNQPPRRPSFLFSFTLLRHLLLFSSSLYALPPLPLSLSLPLPFTLLLFFFATLPSLLPYSRLRSRPTQSPLYYCFYPPGP